jgi:hypothetical protein
MKKLVLVIVGMVGFMSSVAIVENAAAQGVWPPPGYYGYFTPGPASGMNPTYNQYNPWTGRTNRMIDTGRIRNGLPPVVVQNSSGGSDMLYAPKAKHNGQKSRTSRRSSRRHR